MKPRSNWILARRPQWPIIARCSSCSACSPGTSSTSRACTRRSPASPSASSWPGVPAVGRSTRSSRGRTASSCRCSPSRQRWSSCRRCRRASSTRRSGASSSALPVGKIIGITLAGGARRSRRAPRIGHSAHVRRPGRRRRARRHRLHGLAAHERARVRGTAEVSPTRARSRCCSARASRSSFGIVVTLRSRHYRRRGARRAGVGGAFCALTPASSGSSRCRRARPQRVSRPWPRQGHPSTAPREAGRSPSGAETPSR